MQTRTRVLVSVLLLSQAAFGQTFGSISGEAHDTTGAIITGARMTAINIGTNASRTVTTNDAGGYSFPSLVHPNSRKMNRSEPRVSRQLGIGRLTSAWSVRTNPLARWTQFRACVRA
jgi:hypothetical protein